MALDVIREFDPWRDPWCTCPNKYGLNPYTGCAHRCVYCYITSYIPNAFRCRPKARLLERVARDTDQINRRFFISMSNSSDPYPPAEAKLELTRKCLDLFRRKRVRVQIITKSDLVRRDIDILRETECIVSFTITTLRERVRRKLEPNAPPSERRLQAMAELSREGIPVTLRLDPVFPLLTEDEVEEIVEAAVSAGAKHVTSSTFKPRPDGWRRFAECFPKEAEEIRDLYFVRGFRRRGARYLPDEERKRLLSRVKRACEHHHVTVGFCREMLPLGNRTCDGSHLFSHL